MPALFYNGIKGLIHKNGKLLILKSKDHKGKSYWDIPGGRMESNETITQALHRELQEELPGISSIGEPTLLNVWRFPGFLPDGYALILLFHLIDADIDDNPELSDEHSGYMWVSEEDIEHLGDSDTYIERGYLDAIKIAFKLMESNNAT